MRCSCLVMSTDVRGGTSVGRWPRLFVERHERAIMSNGSGDAVEEDWSLVMSGTTTGFAQHETRRVQVSPLRALRVACVPALSPLDMMNLTHGVHDATGHRIWMGAYFFIEAIARYDSLKEFFRSKHVLEIGCGCGVSGLALLIDSFDGPKSILFTDSDAAALELCAENCQRNLSSDYDKRYSVENLRWGDFLKCNFDTVLATDLLYDISSLNPMLRTVARTLKPNGHLILAHVPRASLPGKAKVGTAEELECYIARQARKHSLELKAIIRPGNLCKDTNDAALNCISFQEMEEAGAAILVFGVEAADTR